MKLTRQGVVLAIAALWVGGCREPRTDTPASGVITADTLTVAPTGDTLDFGPMAGPAISAAGYIVVSSVQAKGGQQLALYDSVGQLIKLFTPRGEGPGETRQSGAPRFGPGDTLYVLDGWVQNVFTPPPELRFVRRFAFPTFCQQSVDGAPGGRVVRNPDAPTPRPRRMGGGWAGPGRIAPPCEMTWNGEYVRTYGRPIVSDTPSKHPRTIAPAGDTLIWWADPRRYEIELRGVDSTYRRIVRRVDWFPGDTTRRRDPKTPPPPRIWSMSEGDGVLWLMITRPTKDWKPSAPIDPAKMIISPAGLPTGLTADPREDRSEYVIEALDVETGKLLASTVFSPDTYYFVRPGVVFQKLQDSTGGYWLRVLRLSVER
jgi:hypothetical protein